MKSFSLLLVLMLATATQAQTTRILQTVDFDSVSAAAMCGVGDVDQDGTPDYAVALQHELDSGSSATGVVQVFSGADGSQLFVFQSDEVQDSFGSSVAAAGDVDRDGFADILIGAKSADGSFLDAGAAMVFSGRDGSLIHRIDGSGPSAFAGTACAGMGDINGDGHDDFAVGAPAADGDGEVRIYSGRDGSSLMKISGKGRTGASLANMGDVNADGVNDIAIGQPGHIVKTAGTPRGRVRVYSGASGALLLSVAGDGDFSESGHDVSNAGDITGDGIDDLAVAEPFRVDPNTGSMGRVKLVSGANGMTIRTLDSPSMTMSLGLQMDAIGDMDGDGFPEMAVMQEIQGGFEATVFSGSTGNVMDVFPAHRFGFDGTMCVAGVGDMNNDGLADIGTVSVRNGTADADTNTQIRVYETGRDAVKQYFSKGAPNPPLALSWVPSHGNKYDTNGHLECAGMSANSQGVLLVSLAPVDFPAYGNYLMVAVDPMSLVNTYDVLAPKTGSLVLPTISRRSPGMAGLKTFVQMWEVAPAVRSSNGVRFILIP